MRLLARRQLSILDVEYAKVRRQGYMLSLMITIVNLCTSPRLDHVSRIVVSLNRLFVVSSTLTLHMDLNRHLRCHNPQQMVSFSELARWYSDSSIHSLVFNDSDLVGVSTRTDVLNVQL